MNEEQRLEFAQKPHLQLYIGCSVREIVRGDQPWEWGIRLDDGVEIRNKDRRETFVPAARDLVGAKVQTIMFSLQDTTILFNNGVRWSLNPTQYAIYDPRYSTEGEAYPQWPGELEDAGIPSHPEEGVSVPPQEGWDEKREQIVKEHDARITSTAQEWVKEDEND